MAKVALLIGVSEYEPGLNSLPAAVKDVEAMRQVLEHPDMGGFSEAHILVLKNPDRQQMEEAIENLFAGHQRDDLLLLFFSGHGIKDVETGRFYLTTRQTRKNPQGDLIRSTSVSAASIHDSMSRSRSRRQVVILDSCFSGAFADGLSAKDDGTINIQEELGGEGRAILTSSTSTQPSFEEKGQDLSVYTRYLVEGIQTGAADYDRDGIVSIGELHDYAKKHVQAIRPTMKPEIYPGREGSSIRLAKAPSRDPHFLYRKTLKQLVSRDELSKIPHDNLDALRKRYGVPLEKANEIEEEVLREYRQFKRNWQQYYQQFSAAVEQQHYPLNSENRDYLKALQQLLELTDKDIEQIEAQILLQRGLSDQSTSATNATFMPTLRSPFAATPSPPIQGDLRPTASVSQRGFSAKALNATNQPHRFFLVFHPRIGLVVGVGIITLVILSWGIYQSYNWWQKGQYESEVVRQADEQHTKENELLEKARTERQQGNLKASISTLNTLLLLNPSNVVAQKELEDIERVRKLNQAYLDKAQNAMDSGGLNNFQIAIDAARKVSESTDQKRGAATIIQSAQELQEQSRLKQSLSRKKPGLTSNVNSGNSREPQYPQTELTPSPNAIVQPTPMLQLTSEQCKQIVDKYLDNDEESIKVRKQVTSYGDQTKSECERLGFLFP